MGALNEGRGLHPGDPSINELVTEGSHYALNEGRVFTPAILPIWPS
ncbi:MAG: hypothetical protein ACRDH5_02820 [bacterium]